MIIASDRENGIPAIAQCLSCHQTIAADKPAIEKLALLAKENKPMTWARVYRIPDYVWFSHRAHLEAGATCRKCHGPVAERDALWRETDISMKGCMACHREQNASNDCNYCHEPR